MHRLSAAFVLGYHGCTKDVAESVLSGEAFRPSENEYDWLGHGAYFWEANPARGLEFIGEAYKRNHGHAPAPDEVTVVGAVIDMGLCLDLMSLNGIRILEPAYRSFKRRIEQSGSPMPGNKGGTDLLTRALDCAVINHIHEAVAKTKRQPFDTVRGAFMEGGPAYPGAGFQAKTHIQICVRNLKCIKGVFRVPPEHIGNSS